jgi:hypothetical protein
MRHYHIRNSEHVSYPARRAWDELMGIAISRNSSLRRDWQLFSGTSGTMKIGLWSLIS